MGQSHLPTTHRNALRFTSSGFRLVASNNAAICDAIKHSDAQLLRLDARHRHGLEVRLHIQLARWRIPRWCWQSPVDLPDRIWGATPGWSKPSPERYARAPHEKNSTIG